MGRRELGGREREEEDSEAKRWGERKSGRGDRQDVRSPKGSLHLATHVPWSGPIFTPKKIGNPPTT
jgi:hypothetical protein